MTAKTLTVEIGGQTIEIPKFTIGDLEEIAEWLAGNVENRTLKVVIDHNAQLLEIAFRRAKPALNAGEIRALPTDVIEIRDAVAAVLDFTGFISREAPPNPEASAPTNGASSPSEISSTGSSPTSPPVAASRLN